VQGRQDRRGLGHFRPARPLAATRRRAHSGADGREALARLAWERRSTGCRASLLSVHPLYIPSQGSCRLNPRVIVHTPVPASDESGKLARDPRSRLQRSLDEGRAVITVELAVPATVAHEVVIERARALLRPQIVAVNITDGLRGRPALSSIAAAAIITHADLGVEPILQLTARSRPRNGLVADLLGASALGVRNLNCMTGDVPENSTDLYDVDVFALIEMARAFPAELGIDLLHGATSEDDAAERYWAYLDGELEWLAGNVPLRGCHLMPIGHSKRSMRQQSTFERLYACAIKITGPSAAAAAAN